ncbi:MAG: hypothetical protein WAS27_03560 [Candidatus Saccharimonadales bacterium]
MRTARWYGVSALRVFGASLACIVLLGAFTSARAEEPSATPSVADTTNPVLVLNIQPGAVRNTVKAILTIDDEHPKTAFIEVLHADGTSFSPPQRIDSDQATSSIMLYWKTNDVPDGEYMIRYGATDHQGNAAEATVTVTVDNNTPVVTLSPTIDHRTIGGSVSHADAIITIQVDDAAVAILPKIAETPDDEGNYIWTAILPDTVSDGDHHVRVMATRSVTQSEGEPHVYTAPDVTGQLTVLTISPAPVPEPPVSVVPIGTPMVAFVSELGQFVAPALPTEPMTPITRLYGAAVSDIVGDDTSSGMSTPRSSVAVEPLAVTAAQDDESVIVASESGWIVLGTAWYWWVLGAVGTGAAITLMVRMSYHRQARLDEFIRAESV